MPDVTGALTPDDNAKIQNWWQQHWKAPVTCPVCKTTEWTVAPHVVNLQRHAADAAVANTTSYPHILVTCNNCSHSMFFNAVQIGISPFRPVSLNALTTPNYLGGIFGTLTPTPDPAAPPPSFGLLGLLNKKDK